MAIPEIDVQATTDIISTVVSCDVTFSVNENFREVEVRATLEGQSYGRGIGDLVMSMSISSPNYYSAGTKYSFVITDENLTRGDGTYRISLYAKNVDGVWSDAVAFQWDGPIASGWDRGIWI